MKTRCCRCNPTSGPLRPCRRPRPVFPGTRRPIDLLPSVRASDRKGRGTEPNRAEGRGGACSSGIGALRRFHRLRRRCRWWWLRCHDLVAIGSVHDPASGIGRIDQPEKNEGFVAAATDAAFAPGRLRNDPPSPVVGRYVALGEKDDPFSSRCCCCCSCWPRL